MFSLSRPALLLAACLGPALVPAPVAAQRAPAPAAATAAPANGIVAVVNGDAISRADVASRARLFALNVGMNAAPELVQRMAPQILRQLIDEKLRQQEVLRRRIPVQDNEVGEAIQELEGRNGLASGALTQRLRAAGVQPRVLFDQVRTQLGWGRLLRQLLGPQAEVSDADVQDAIRNSRANIGQPEFMLSEIFIPVDDPAAEPEARRFSEDVIGQLRRGTPFAVAATQFSQAQTALQGGDLGWVRKEGVDTEVAAILDRMPVGAISNPIRVPGGFQIVQLRQRRESGRDMATVLSVRQVFFPFQGTVNPQAPTDQQRSQVEKGQRLSQTARDCSAMEQAARGSGSDRPVDPGPVRLESLAGPLRSIVGGLAVGRPSQPLISPEGVMVFMVCSRDSRNMAELTPAQAREQLLRDRVELLSRQLQRDLRRRATIEMRS